MTATTKSPPAIPSTSGLANVSTRALIPISRKNTGMNRWPTGASSRSIRSTRVLPDSARPATNAPTIGASCAASASSANPSVNANTYRDERLPRSARGDRGTGRARCEREPTNVATTRKPIATSRISATSAIDTEPSDTSRTTTVRITSPSTSSATAAPSTVRASTVASARRSLNTRAVMPDAGRRERRADEQRLVAAVAQRRRDRVAAGHRHDDADRRDRQRRSPDRTEIGDVHLHADAEEQQDHPELAEHAQRLVRPHEPEDRRPDDDPGDDLAHDRRHVDPLGDLRGELRRDEHDEDVQQDRSDIHRVSMRSAGAVGVDALEHVAPRPHGADFEPERRDAPTQPQHVHVERVAGGVPPAHARRTSVSRPTTAP